MSIVFKCENSCGDPDQVIFDPMDDNMICVCGGSKWGHYTNVEDPKLMSQEDVLNAIIYLRKRSDFFDLSQQEQDTLEQFLDHVMTLTCDNCVYLAVMVTKHNGELVKFCDECANETEGFSREALLGDECYETMNPDGSEEC